MDYRNAQPNSVGGFDCEVNHPDFGWIPFTVLQDDCECFGAGLYPILVSELGEPPMANAVKEFPSLTARQLRLALIDRIDEVDTIIQESEDKRLMIEWEYATEFNRDHHAIISIGEALGLTPEQIDEMWMDAVNT